MENRMLTRDLEHKRVFMPSDNREAQHWIAKRAGNWVLIKTQMLLIGSLPKISLFSIKDPHLYEIKTKIKVSGHPIHFLLNNPNRSQSDFALFLIDKSEGEIAIYDKNLRKTAQILRLIYNLSDHNIYLTFFFSKKTNTIELLFDKYNGRIKNSSSVVYAFKSKKIILWKKYGIVKHPQNTLGEALTFYLKGKINRHTEICPLFAPRSPKCQLMQRTSGSKMMSMTYYQNAPSQLMSYSEIFHFNKIKWDRFANSVENFDEIQRLLDQNFDLINWFYLKRLNREYIALAFIKYSFLSLIYYKIISVEPLKIKSFRSLHVTANSDISSCRFQYSDDFLLCTPQDIKSDYTSYWIDESLNLIKIPQNHSGSSIVSLSKNGDKIEEMHINKISKTDWSITWMDYLINPKP